MGPQQILRTAVVVAGVVALGGTASAAPRLGDRVAVIDLGPPDESVRQKLGAAIVAAGLELLIGDGVDDALAGIARDRDSLLLAAAIADAQAKFGALACSDAVAAAQTAIELGAARQAAGLDVPELPRALTYLLLCADRIGDVRTAQTAATHLRTLGATSDVDARTLARYPEVDALSNREVIELVIEAEVSGADIWVDFRRVGTAPMKLVVTAGSHVIAAGSGSRHGVLTGTVVKTQPTVTVPMPDRSGPHAKLAARVAGFGGTLPPAKELESVMNAVGARVALVRHGTIVEAWGHANRGERLRRLGNDDGVRPLAEVDQLAALIADRVQGWNDRAPDPDQPLLVETPDERRRRGGKRDDEEPTAWWVYATIAGALVTGAIVIYANDSSEHTQRVELRYP